MGEMEDMKEVQKDHEARLRIQEKKETDDAVFKTKVLADLKLFRWQFVAFIVYALGSLSGVKIPTIIKLIGSL